MDRTKTIRETKPGIKSVLSSRIYYVWSWLLKEGITYCTQFFAGVMGMTGQVTTIYQILSILASNMISNHGLSLFFKLSRWQL